MTTHSGHPGRKAPGRAAGIVVTGLVFIALSGAILRGQGIYEGPAGLFEFLGLGFAVAACLLSGALLIWKQPRNVIGWLLVIPGVFPQLGDLALAWLVGMDPPPEEVDLLVWLSIGVTNWSWIFFMFPIFLILLTFPDGRLLSPRWRWVAILIGLMTATMVGFVSLAPQMEVMIDEEMVWSVANPIGLPYDSGDYDGFFTLVWVPALLVVTVASVAAVIIRYRRGTPEEKEQFKWPLWGVITFGVFFVANMAPVTSGQSPLFDMLFGFAVATIPVSVAVAVLKYRLYDIDRIISRTVAYVAVVGLLGGVYAAGVFVLRDLLPLDGPLPVAASTLAVAALFNPLRRRVQGAVDRRFNRSRYDTQQVMGRFAESLRDEVDADHVVEGWRNVVTSTMEPASVGVWVKERSYAPIDISP